MEEKRWIDTLRGTLSSLTPRSNTEALGATSDSKPSQSLLHPETKPEQDETSCHTLIEAPRSPMRPFIDLHALALDETVVRIASFLRSRFSCWVGITSSELGAIPLTAEGTGPPLPACRLFMRHPLHHEGRDTISTCQGDTIRWGGHTEEQREVRCHAGFHAILHPVSSSIGTIGTLYASGWTPQSSEAASLVDIRRALGRIHVDSARDRRAHGDDRLSP